MSALVEAAFAAVGEPGPGYRKEIGLVARAIRQSGDREALELFGVGAVPDPDPVFDRDAYERVVGVAERAGKPHDALDLYTAVVNPGWAPFGDGPYYEDAA